MTKLELLKEQRRELDGQIAKLEQEGQSSRTVQKMLRDLADRLGDGRCHVIAYDCHRKPMDFQKPYSYLETSSDPPIISVELNSADYGRVFIKAGE